MTPPAELSALVAELRKLEEKATRVPWVYRGDGTFPTVGTTEHMGGFTIADADWTPPTGNRWANAALIAAMRNALPQLLAAAEERDALRGALETCESALSRCTRVLGYFDHDDALPAQREAENAVAAAEKALRGA